MEKEFLNLKEELGLPRVVFQSLRHPSTTYKLKLNHGDLKATQGDTGHTEIDMITRVYAHILDEDRKINAQKFGSTFPQYFSCGADKIAGVTCRTFSINSSTKKNCLNTKNLANSSISKYEDKILWKAPLTQVENPQK